MSSYIKDDVEEFTQEIEIPKVAWAMFYCMVLNDALKLDLLLRIVVEVLKSALEDPNPIFSFIVASLCANLVGSNEVHSLIKGFCESSLFLCCQWEFEPSILKVVDEWDVGYAIF